MRTRLGTEQRAAAFIGGGPIRVVAGAGTGKTAVIAERFGRLVAAGTSHLPSVAGSYSGDQSVRAASNSAQSVSGASAGSSSNAHG